MKNIIIAFCLFCVVFAVQAQKYPTTKKNPHQITQFNITYNDDYEWLEDVQSEAVKNWRNAQNETANLYLEDVKKKYNILGKIKEYKAFSSGSLPAKKEAYYYKQYILDKKNTGVLFYRKELNGNPVELFNPFKIYRDNVAAISGYMPSKNSRYMACAVSLDGSDRQEIRFVDFDKIKLLDDIVKDVKFSNIAWNRDSGIFYKRNTNQKTFERDSTYFLYYHKLGTPSGDDKLVFDASDKNLTYRHFTKDDKLYVLVTNERTGLQSFYFAYLNQEDFKLEKFYESLEDYDYHHITKDKIYFSKKDYQWGEVRVMDLNKQNEETQIIPQTYNHLLLGVSFYDDYILCQYKNLGKYYVAVYDLQGNFVRKFFTPEGTSFSIKFYDSKYKNLYVSVYSYTISPQNFKLNITTGSIDQYYNDYLPPTPTLFPLDHFVTKNITCKSRDGVDIPLTIIYKKGTALDGNNPTLLEAYGGFGVVSGPSFEPGLLCFLEKGGVFCFAEIRGGGEKGTKWHTDAVKLKKMNSFNDFIDAAEFLIKEKYTSPQKLAITGGSYGGLVVGVAMTQRPDLFKVAVPKVGVYDMLKFEQFTVGRYHLDEFGSAKKPEDFKMLYSYSPYHNIKEDVNYPITYIITSENDDRVPPLHSYKFAASLQNRAAQKNPIILKTRSDAGHYGKSSYQDYFEDEAEFYDFILYHLNP